MSTPPDRRRPTADVDRLQIWLNTHHLKSLKVQKRGHDLVRQVQERDVGKYTDRVVSFVEGAAISIGKTLFSVVLLVVISIYMLLDMQRLGRIVDRRFPPRPGELPLLRTIEHALASYVRGQAALSLIIGAAQASGSGCSAATGLLPGGEQYALLFGAWVAVTEVIPYLGPWLGAAPPFIYALVVHPISALWVALLFLGIHQIEGHIVVPNVMGNALRLHPLLVIFGLAVGAELYGLVGALIALPLLAVGRAIWEFFAERIDLEPWQGEPVPVEVELVAAAYPEVVSSFPATRLRRLRRTGRCATWCARRRVSLDDLVLPLFVAPEALPNDRLPALSRHTVDGARARVRGARAGRRSGCDPVRHPRGEGRRGLRRLDRGRDRAAGAARAAAALPRAAARDRRLPLRVHLARSLRRRRATARSTTTRRSS